MSSDCKDKRPVKSKGVWKSFHFAIQGITHAFVKERNMKIHTVITAVVVALGLWIGLTAIEWLFVIFAIGGVLCLELLNTAIERVIDLISPDYHPLAKQAKDVAAGAVFIYSLLAVIVGVVIFFPKLI